MARLRSCAGALLSQVSSAGSSLLVHSGVKSTATCGAGNGAVMRGAWGGVHQGRLRQSRQLAGAMLCSPPHRQDTGSTGAGSTQAAVLAGAHQYKGSSAGDDGDAVLGHTKVLPLQHCRAGGRQGSGAGLEGVACAATVHVAAIHGMLCCAVEACSLLTSFSQYQMGWCCRKAVVATQAAAEQGVACM
jgi:hypothetical protein